MRRGSCVTIACLLLIAAYLPSSTLYRGVTWVTALGLPLTEWSKRAGRGFRMAR